MITTWPRLVVDEYTTYAELRDFLEEVEAAWHDTHPTTTTEESAA